MIEEYLKTLNRSQLMTLTKDFGTIKVTPKLKNEDMIKNLSTNGIIDEVVINHLQNGKTSLDKELEDYVDAAKHYREVNIKIDEKIEKEKKLEKISNSNINNYYQSYMEEEQKSQNSIIKLEQLKKTTRDKISNETIICTIMPLNPNDVSLGKKAEIFTFRNLYNAKSLLVPFNIPVEIPICIYNIIKDATYRTSEETNVNDFGTISTIQTRKKYNIVIHDKEQLKARAV